LFALIGLAASSALLAGYLQSNSGFCGFDSSCDHVLHSPFGRFLGVPLPFIGVLTFAALLAIPNLPLPWKRQLLRTLSVCAGMGGLFLILVQVAAIGQVCPYCLVVDTSAILLAIIEIGWKPGELPPVSKRRTQVICILTAGAALGVGFVLGSVSGSRPAQATGSVPREVTRHWLPGKINVVEVADFQCPQCRQMQPVLMQFVHELGDRVHFVQLTAPMPSHHQARNASRAFLCAQKQGQGEAMAELLFSAAALTPKQCEKLAESLGLSMGSFCTCVTDPATDRRLDATLDWVKAASPQGLPAIWIQDRMLFGMRSLDSLREAARGIEDSQASMARR
jgi:uncharacterized membrane protein/protein-disulfide isomerase